MEIRPLTPTEQKYTYAQSMQIEGQTGTIGHLRGDFATTGYGFYTTWFDTRPQWKSDEFKTDLDTVINALREDKGLLHNRYDMGAFARKYPESAMQGNYCTEYGFRVDTGKHAFLFRCNPTKGDYNFYCYCYVKEWLNQHMERSIALAKNNSEYLTQEIQKEFSGQFFQCRDESETLRAVHMIEVHGLYSALRKDILNDLSFSAGILKMDSAQMKNLIEFLNFHDGFHLEELQELVYKVYDEFMTVYQRLQLLLMQYEKSLYLLLCDIVLVHRLGQVT